MDTINVQSLSLPKAQGGNTKNRKCKPPRHQAGERFLKGPIPLDWLCKAAQLPGKSLQVALAIWFLSGLSNSATVRLGNSVLCEMGVDRHSKKRALTQLTNAQLISVQRSSGQAPVVTILNLVKCEV